MHGCRDKHTTLFYYYGIAYMQFGPLRVLHTPPTHGC